jgi:hypothetical protein
VDGSYDQRPAAVAEKSFLLLFYLNLCFKKKPLFVLAVSSAICDEKDTACCTE